LAIILGIDPGSRFTGWGVIETEKVGKGPRSAELTCLGQGVIELPEKKPLAFRLAAIDEALDKIVRQYRPDVFSVERVFLGKNPDSAFKLGHARGIVLAVAGRHRLTVHEYATRSAKKMLTGNGAATKEQVQFIIENLLRIRESRLDATDALALAVCHAREAEVLARFSVHELN
jgi:crossover junction endodeoxyribonuclease RuvC